MRSSSTINDPTLGSIPGIGDASSYIVINLALMFCEFLLRDVRQYSIRDSMQFSCLPMV